MIVKTNCILNGNDIKGLALPIQDVKMSIDELILLIEGLSLPAAKLASINIRISIMSRHTLSDGVSPDERLTTDLYDLWWTELAPRPTTVGSYYRGRDKQGRVFLWDDFVREFNLYLQSETVNNLLLKLIELAKIVNVTLMCVEDEPSRCHRRLVVERCLELDPSLEVIIE